MVRGLKQQGCTPGNTTENMPGWRAVGGRDKQRALRKGSASACHKKNFTYRCPPLLSCPALRRRHSAVGRRRPLRPNTHKSLRQGQKAPADKKLPPTFQ